jgi:hypothetical protein
MTAEREYSPRRFAVGAVFCPSCGGKLERESPWCPACGFTGSKTLDLFGADPPPLLPLLDVADIWNAKDQRAIKSAISRFNRRFPQIRWRICGVALGEDVSLPLFGFWLLNASPFAEGETEEERSWTVLLLIDSARGWASVTPGYRAEIWLSEDMWEKALARTVEPLRKGEAAVAVIDFLKSSQALFEMAWHRSRKQLAHHIDR